MSGTLKQCIGDIATAMHELRARRKICEIYRSHPPAVTTLALSPTKRPPPVTELQYISDTLTTMLEQLWTVNSIINVFPRSATPSAAVSPTRQINMAQREWQLVESTRSNV